MTKIYVVEFGEYSGRFVAAVYTSQDEADAVARASGEGTVSEFDLDPPLDDAEKRHLRPGERAYHVSMGADGNNAVASPAWRDIDEEFYVRPDGQRISTHCWASSEKHAIKIANERRTAWKIAGSPCKGRVSLSTGWIKVTLK